MSREFPVAPFNPWRLWLLPAIALVAMLIGLTLVVLDGDRQAAWGFPFLLLAAAVIAGVVRRRRVSLQGHALLVAAGFNTRRVVVADLDLGAARVVDLREHIHLKPMLRLNGTGLIGYQCGHFLLRDRTRAFVLLTDHSRVLMLPEKSGKRLLLSLQQPQALLDALRHMAQPRTAR